ncbi:MAG: DUF1064 domain-containing protein [Gemmatimonadales bacterium]|nr:DUF1064 domain-containing protein [Gemmatimonadales bacterium]
MTKYGNDPHKAIINGETYSFRSKLEHRYAGYLELLRRADEIEGWEYEPEYYDFEEIDHGVTRYLPDFKVFYADKTFELHECKGALDGKSKTKLRRMRKYYPDIHIVLVIDRLPAGRTAKSRHRRSQILDLCGKHGIQLFQISTLSIMR